MRWAALVLAISAAASADPRFFDRGCPRLEAGRSDRGFCTTFTYDGGQYEFLRADGYGAPLAPCTGQALAIVTADGDAGVAVSFSRGSSAYCTKTATGGNSTTGIANGDLVLLTSGQPRVEYDTGGALGIRIEVTKQNVLTKSQAFDHANWANFIAGAGTNPSKGAANTDTSPDGTVDAEQVTFNATGAADSSGLSQTVLTAAAYSGGVYVRGNATTNSGTVDLCMDNAATATCKACAYVLGSWSWCKLENVTSKASGKFYIGNLSSLNGGTTRPQQTVSLWQSDAQLGAFLSSPIATDTIAVTRSTDLATATLPVGVGANFCIAASGTATSANVGATNMFALGVTGAGNNALLWRNTDTSAGYGIGVTTTTPAVSSMGTTTHRWFLSDTAGTRVAKFDTGVVSAPAASLSGAQTAVHIGASSTDGVPFEGLLSRIQIDSTPTRCTP